MLYGEVVPRSTLHASSVPAYSRNDALDTSGGFEDTRTLTRRKSLYVQVQIWFGPRNVGTFSGKSGEISKMLRRHHNDIFCLQELRWKDKGGKLIMNG